MRISAPLCAVILAMATVPTIAGAVRIDFDTLPGGGTIADETLIGTQYSSVGATFSAIDGGSTLLPVATLYAGGPSGPFYSGNYLGNSNNGAPGNPRYDIVRIAFSAAASGISLSLNNFSNVGTTTFNAYDGNGMLLQTFTTTANSGWALRTVTATGVRRLDLLNNSFNGSELFYGIDNLNFTLAATPAVPEPATWTAMVLGFGATGIALRRRRMMRTA